MRSEGSRSALTPPRSARGRAHALLEQARVGVGDRPELTLERERPVLGGPLAHVLEVVRELLRRARTAPRSSTSTGSVSKRHGYGSALPGLPGQIFVRSSYISPVTRTMPPNACTFVR